jgi:predicted PurR-regulated permease PerM
MKNNRYLIFAGIFVLLTLWMVRDFVPGIGWGAIFALSLWPLYEKFVAKTGSRLKNPALVFSVLFMVLFLLPLAYVGYTLADLYSVGSTFLVKNQAGVIPVPEFFEKLPYHAKLIEFWTVNIGPSTNVLETANLLSHGKLTLWLSSAAVQLSSGLVSALCMLVSFYFMLKHGSHLRANYAQAFEHWFSDKSVEAVNKGISALRGTINGVILVGLLEGVLLAIPLVAADVKSGLLLGLIAGVLGVIPLVMPALILPCAGYLYFNGQTGWAIATLVVLAFAWFAFENVIKPSIISNAVKVNPYLVLLGLVGGLQLLGPVGLFLGPALVAVSVGMAKDMLVPNTPSTVLPHA